MSGNSIFRFRPPLNASQIRFWSYPVHHEYQWWYGGGDGNQRLLFCTQFATENLPAGGTHHGLQCELVLQRLAEDPAAPGYVMPIYTAYEHDSVEVMGVDWKPYYAQALMHYWYADHHCPCHRRQDAESVGYVAQDEDYEPGVLRDECGAIRFKIRRIWAAALPDLILYSETLTETELYARLGGKL